MGVAALMTDSAAVQMFNLCFENRLQMSAKHGQ